MTYPQDGHEIIFEAISDDIWPSGNKLSAPSGDRPATLEHFAKAIGRGDQQVRHTHGCAGIELIDIGTNADDILLSR
jgi:hypothetical protein